MPGQGEKSPAERLCEAVAAAQPVVFQRGTGSAIKADVIRRLALQQPLEGEERACAITPFGIRIYGARVKGRILLDNARPRDIRPVCPIEFHDCVLEGGFDGAHGHFSRLAFKDCRFSDSPAEDGRDLPTIDLSGADIDSDLDLVGIRPVGIGPNSVKARNRGNHLWIRLIGARIRGEIDLCRSHLRAPAFKPHPVVDDAENALDLTLADVTGDLQIVGGARCEGRVKIRTASLAGDVWMSGARLEIAPDEHQAGNDEALTFQGSRIGGYLMMNGDFDQVAGEPAETDLPKPRFRKFRCTGTLRLEGAEIGRSLHLQEAVVRGDIKAAQLSVRDDLRLHAKVSGSIDISACRIGGSLDLSRLNLASTARCVNLKDGNIGRTLHVAEPSVPYELLKIRRVNLKSLPGLQLVETLWGLARGEDGKPAKDENAEEVPMSRRLVQAAFLVEKAAPGLRRLLRLDEMRIYHLDGHADVLLRAVRRYGFLGRTEGSTGEVDPASREAETSALWEYAQLHGAYVLAEEGFVRIQSAASREAGSGAVGVFRAAAAVGGRIEERVFEVRWTGEEVQLSQRRGRGPSTAQEDPRWFINGLVVIPPDRETTVAATVARGDWLAPAPLPGMRELRYFRLGSRPQRGLMQRIRRWLKRRPIEKLKARIAHHVESIPLLQAEFNLEGLTCDMLDDRGGRAWGEHSDRIRMNHFVYRRANWGPQAKSSARYVWNRVRSARADWFWSPTPRQWPEGLRRRLRRSGIDWPWLSGLSAPAERLREESDYLEPWQVRRNWIYRHFVPEKLSSLISISRFRIAEGDYRPQPFEQAVLVARAEGREDYAARFEMLKSGNEWRHFNERVRWWLGPAAITVASCWLLGHGGSVGLTFAAWAATLAMMVWISGINGWLRGLAAFRRWWPRRVAREVLLYTPALILLAADWWSRPFYYIISFLFYVAIRFAGVLCHAVMRFGFGYLRRPVRAIVTLILAFLAGWGGVAVAVDHEMLVIDATAVADRAGAHGSAQGPLLMGSKRVAAGPDFVHEPLCTPVLSERLYALDVLLPLVDLNEEGRCEVRRTVAGGAEHSAAREPGEMSGGELLAYFPGLTVGNHRFWWWMKALYAIAGWFIVSLALLTFTQVNRTRGEIADS